MDRERIAAAVREVLLALDQDITREGFRDTPYRVADTFIEQCTPEDPELHRVFNEERYEELVMVRDIHLMSFCEHHLLPFWGRAHVAYIPGDRILGISKLARLVSSYSRGFQIQERMTRDMADELMMEIEPRGVMVVIEATHACIAFRGARAIGSMTVTCASRGVFKCQPATRRECMSLMMRSER
jgi:GTP cyclohydrolase IA